MWKRTDKKYTMVVFEEDERYGSNGIQLDFYADNPWEGNLSDIVEGDNVEELWKSSDGHINEGLFYMLYENETGKKIGYGIVDYGAIRDEIAECEKENKLPKRHHTVKTICYGKEREWDSREEAMNFFLEGMCSSEGSEFERYAKIYTELTLGLEVCSDEIED